MFIALFCNDLQAKKILNISRTNVGFFGYKNVIQTNSLANDIHIINIDCSEPGFARCRYKGFSLNGNQSVFSIGEISTVNNMYDLIDDMISNGQSKGSMIKKIKVIGSNKLIVIRANWDKLRLGDTISFVFDEVSYVRR